MKNRPFSWSTLEDLKGMNVGAHLGSSYPKLEEAEKKGLFRLDRVKDYKANFVKLILKRTDVLVGIKSVAYNTLRNEFSPEQQALIIHSPTVKSYEEYHLLFLKKSEKSVRWMNLFNQGFQQLKQSGELDQMWTAYYKGYYDAKSNK